jgi:8-oxo-dGTP pyrophosphatase MutT (NUDIX family)
MTSFKDFIKGKLKKAASIAVFNPQNKLLLLRRSETAEWMPLHYCLPGGHAEEGEAMIETAERELFEETEIELDASEIESFGNYITDEYANFIFVGHTNDSKVKLNFEHDKYVWCNYEECKELNLVPRLGNIINNLKNKGLFEIV